MKGFKYGCLGCLGLIAVAIVAGLGIFAVAKGRAKSLEPERQTLERRSPAPPAGASPEALRAEFPDASGSPGALAPIRVSLDLSGARFTIVPGEESGPFRVEATFDKRYYELTEDLRGADEGGGTYALSFRRKGGVAFITALSEILGGKQPEVRVVLPRGIPMDLGLRLRNGASRADLGGLWLTDADLEFERGGVEIDFSEPLPRPVDHMRLTGRMGGCVLKSVGHASPRDLRIDFNMGGLALDMTGDWRADARIDLRHRMGGVAVRLPERARILGVPGFDEGGEEDPDRPTLMFETSSRMGELEFSRATGSRRLNERREPAAEEAPR